VLDIDPVWFWVQLGSFLAFVFLLNLILFKPFLQIIGERDDRVKKALAEAAAADEERQSVMAAIEKELAEARLRAKAIIEEAKTAGLEEQKRRMEEAAAEAASLTEKAASEIAAAAEAARAKLRQDVEALAGQITGRLLGGRA